jgi:hypothetical protein
MPKPAIAHDPAIIASDRQTAALGCTPPRGFAVAGSAMNCAQRSSSLRRGWRRISRAVSMRMAGSYMAWGR